MSNDKTAERIDQLASKIEIMMLDATLAQDTLRSVMMMCLELERRIGEPRPVRSRETDLTLEPRPGTSAPDRCRP